MELAINCKAHAAIRRNIAANIGARLNADKIKLEMRGKA